MVHPIIERMSCMTFYCMKKGKVLWKWCILKFKHSASTVPLPFNRNQTTHSFRGAILQITFKFVRKVSIRGNWSVNLAAQGNKSLKLRHFQSTTNSLSIWKNFEMRSFWILFSPKIRFCRSSKYSRVFHISPVTWLYFYCIVQFYAIQKPKWSVWRHCRNRVDQRNMRRDCRQTRWAVGSHNLAVTWLVLYCIARSMPWSESKHCLNRITYHHSKYATIK